MHDKYWLLALAAFMVLALYLQWWPGGRPGMVRVCSRASWVAFYLAILSGGCWIVTYSGDAIIGSPKAWVRSGAPFLFLGSPRAWVEAGASFLFWSSLALAGFFCALATYYRFFHRPTHR
jgi:hypothetical protein